MNRSAFGKRLRRTRKERGFTTDNLAEDAGCTAVYIRSLESSKTEKLPSLPLFVSLCNALEVEPRVLLQDSLKTLPQEEADAFSAFVSRLQQLPPNTRDAFIKSNSIILSEVEKTLDTEK